jgi:hypothetical protein
MIRLIIPGAVAAIIAVGGIVREITSNCYTIQTVTESQYPKPQVMISIYFKIH